MSNIKMLLLEYDVRVCNQSSDMYVKSGLLFPKYTDFLSEAKRITSPIEFIYFKYIRHFRICFLDKTFN